MGAIKKRRRPVPKRRRVYRKYPVCKMTETASITKTPPAIKTSASRTPSSVTTRPPRIARSAVAVLELFDEEVLRALPEREAAELGQMLVALGHRREVIARELAHLAREQARAVWKQDLHLGNATGVYE